MKNIKKYLIVLLLSLFIVSVSGCQKTSATNEGEFILPDLTGKSTAEVEEALSKTPLNYQIKVQNNLIYGNKEGEYEFEKFYGYAGKDNVPGATFDTSKKLIVYVTAYNLPTSLDEFASKYDVDGSIASKIATVTMAGKSYENKSFIETGCGEVTVMSYVDGDTTRFKDKNGTQFSLRYLGIDTPESTASFEPWGKAASAHTESSLSTAKKVVIEAETPGQTDSNGRYLGWVWYQAQDDSWHLLNLELILFAFTKDKADTDSTYGDLATTIGTRIGATGRRVWGEQDPNYDYSTAPKEISLQELRTNFGQYYSRKVKVTGVIALMDGKSPVIVDPETGYGIYYYVPSWTGAPTYQLEVGAKVTITGVATYYGIADEDLDNMDEDLGKGSPQLTDFTRDCVVSISENNVVEPVSLTVPELTSSNVGMYCKFENLRIQSVYEASTKSGFTVTCTDENNKVINIRVDNSHYHYIDGDDGLSIEDFEEGTLITSIVGYLTYYAGYQISLISKNNITFE